MTFFRLIAPKELKKPPIEGLLSLDKVKYYNKLGYNVYYLPNHPKEMPLEGSISGIHIEEFNYIFVDFDLKLKTYASKDEFLEKICTLDLPPTKIIDSGNGIHAYWRISDLEVNSYLRLTKRLIRFLNTDPATCSIFQLMRYPNTFNTKDVNNYLPVELLHESDKSYTSEQLNNFLPLITPEDEQDCVNHYNSTFNINTKNYNITDALPLKFIQLLKSSKEVKALWSDIADDRSKNDFRLAHLMYANDFTEQEAASVLMNSAKALTRSDIHRISYANNIISKIWVNLEANTTLLSSSVADILKKNPGDTAKGVRFPCHARIDSTQHGFRLGQVLGLVAGSGVGKTAFALNMFRWFAEQNPDYHHFFVPLEQPAHEIADRWNTMSQGNTKLHEKIQVLSNYDDDGNFRHLSLSDIKDHILHYEKVTGYKVGCVVIDHIGVLKKKGSKDENQDLMTICHTMKAFAVETNTFLVMQSQTNREKAGIGDLELNKDAAYGTMFFEAYCDYLITMWQPLKRCQSDPNCPTVSAFKFCKIRHKKPRQDIIQEDVPYYLYFDSDKELLRDMTESETTRFNYWIVQATNKRKQDRKTDIIKYTSVPYKKEKDEPTINSNKH